MRKWLITWLGGTPPGPVDVKSLEANDWLNKHAPHYVVEAVQRVSTLLRQHNDYVKLLQEENQHLRRQAMHVSHVSPDIPPTAA